MLVDAPARHDFRLVAATLAASLVIHGAVFGLVLPLTANSTAVPARIDAILLAAHAAPAAPEAVASVPPESTVEEPPAPPREAAAPVAEGARARPVKTAEVLPSHPPVSPVSASAAATPLPQPAAAKRSSLTVGAASAPSPTANTLGRELKALAPSITPPSFRADYLANPPPAYPRRARRDGIEGTVTLKILVTAAGAPGRVEVETSSGSVTLDRAALDAVKAWRFVPARRGDEAVDAWVRVPVEFRLESG